VGDRVLVQTWQGRLTLVWAGPYAVRTAQNPDYQYTKKTERLVLLTVFTVVLLTVTDVRGAPHGGAALDRVPAKAAYTGYS
jgi:hypothetical protein